MNDCAKKICMHKSKSVTLELPLSKILKGAAHYAGLLVAPAEGFGLRLRPFFALRAKIGLFISVLAQILVIFGDQ